jgi:hypothetical protein
MANEVTQDRAFKALLEEFAVEALEFFRPQVIAKRGMPISVVPVGQEILSRDLRDPSALLDVALLASWGDGHQEVILLVEHFSESRKVDLTRIAHYVTGLAMRHRRAQIQMPIVLVTDRANHMAPDGWGIEFEGRMFIELNVEIVQVSPEDQPRFIATRNKIAAVLVALTEAEAAQSVVVAMRAMLAAGYTREQVHRFLPLVQNLARMTADDIPRIRQIMSAEVPAMRTFLDEIAEESEAKGVAKGALNLILSSVAKGRLSHESARADIADLVADGTVSQAQADEALARLG